MTLLVAINVSCYYSNGVTVTIIVPWAIKRHVSVSQIRKSLRISRPRHARQDLGFITQTAYWNPILDTGACPCFAVLCCVVLCCVVMG
jgi:hypothetical protein